MKIKKEDLDKINRKVRRDEYAEISNTLVSKVFKNKKKYSRKNNKKIWIVKIKDLDC